MFSMKKTNNKKWQNKDNIKNLRLSSFSVDLQKTVTVFKISEPFSREN